MRIGENITVINPVNGKISNGIFAGWHDEKLMLAKAALISINWISVGYLCCRYTPDNSILAQYMRGQSKIIEKFKKNQGEV
jgi:hypothetical protein